MFKNISGKLVNSAVEKNIIKSEDIEDCIYGLNTFFTTTINIVSALIIGLAMNMLIEIVLFIIVYKSLRKYVGGSHSKTAARCYISSCITYIAALLIIRYYPLSSIMTSIIAVVISVILCVISPVAAEKKPLDDIEKRVFKHRSCICVILFLGIFLLLHYIQYGAYTYYYSIVVFISICTVTVFALIGMLFKLTKKVVAS